MAAPETRPHLLKWIWMNLPKRLHSAGAEGASHPHPPSRLQSRGQRGGSPRVVVPHSLGIAERLEQWIRLPPPPAPAPAPFPAHLLAGGRVCLYAAGLTSSTCDSTVRPVVLDLPPTPARYSITSFVVSVFPAPDSPLMRMDWLCLHSIMALDPQRHTRVTRQPAGKGRASEHSLGAPVGSICDCKDMGGLLSYPSLAVLGTDGVAIEVGETLKGIDGDEDGSRVRLEGNRRSGFRSGAGGGSGSGSGFPSRRCERSCSGG